VKHLRCSVTGVLVLIVLMSWSGFAWAAGMEELVAAAKKEGVLDMYAPSSLTPPGAQTLIEAFNKKYNLQIRVNYHPGSSFTRDVGKVVGMAATGVPPEWDLMVIHDAGHATLWLRKLHLPYDYKGLGIDPRAIHYDSGTLSFAHMIVQPAYNKSTIKAQDVPKKWEDLLDPKWKGSKLGMSTATHHLARLAAGPWGEKKTTEFTTALAAQQPFLGTLAEITTRLQLGEVLVAITLIDQFIYRAHAKGAPLAFADGVEPVVSPAWQAGVLRNAPHSSAARLFSIFLLTPEAQKIWDKFTGGASAFVPGTKTHEYLKDKQVVYMTQDQSEMIDRLTQEYGKIFGFSK
jgi:iron(III) transport system substrate-binding protein